MDNESTVNNLYFWSWIISLLLSWKPSPLSTLQALIITYNSPAGDKNNSYICFWIRSPNLTLLFYVKLAHLSHNKEFKLPYDTHERIQLTVGVLSSYKYLSCSVWQQKELLQLSFNACKETILHKKTITLLRNGRDYDNMYITNIG